MGQCPRRMRHRGTPDCGEACRRADSRAQLL